VPIKVQELIYDLCFLHFGFKIISLKEIIILQLNLLPGIRFFKDASLTAGLWIICVVFLELVGLPGTTV